MTKTYCENPKEIISANSVYMCNALTIYYTIT